MTNLIIPEDLKETIEDIVAYEEIEKFTEEEMEWMQEWLYIDIPTHDSADYTKQESWKIEIEL